jgi:hypothetical protein
MHFSYNRIVNLFLFFLISLEFISCSLDDNNIPQEAQIKYVEKNIDTATFWNRSIVYVINKPDFQVNDTLIIQSGTVIKFNPEGGRTMLISETGFVSAQGSSDKPVIFTSLFDSKHGKINGKSSKANKGDWNNIIVNSKQNSFFYMCNFYYGGGDESKSTVEFSQEASAIIKGCVFSENDGGDLESGNGVVNAQFASKKIMLKDNIFYNNNLPIQINTSINLDSSNIFHNPADISVTNKFNGIKVVTTYPMIDSTEWIENEVPFVIAGPKLELSSSSSLLLGNYVVLKFIKGTTMRLSGKNTVIRNNEGPGVIFTSINDDSYKGDTNGDGIKSIPADGDWNIHVANADDFEWGNVFYASKIHE